MSKKTVIAFAILAATSFANEEAFEFSSQNSWVNQATVTKRSPTLFNPDNTLSLADREFESELRPNLKLTYGSHFLGVARPRFKLFSKRVDFKNQSQGSAKMNEIYGQISLTDDIQLAYGKMNYQWGPAELLSPSNRLFENIGMQPSTLYEYTGKELVRMNLTYEKHLNFIVLGEIKMQDNSQGDTLVIKSEYSLREGSDYAGLVVGRSKNEKNWVGEYAAYTPSDALQLYLDASHTHGSNQPIAEKNRFGFWQVVDSKRPVSEPESRLLLGTRFTSERGNELRAEGYYQTDGYTGDDLKDLQASLKAEEPFRLLNLSKFYENKTSLQGRGYAYLAYRVPDIDAKKKLQITPRYLHSFQDYSGIFFVTAEYNINNAWVTQAVATTAHGQNDDELCRNNRASLSMALQYSF